MIDADTRALLMRPDLAEAALEGLVSARAYRPTEAMQAAVPLADVRDDDGNRISQLLFGEAFDVLTREGDRQWGRCRRDGVVGWVAVAALQSGVCVPTLRVSAPGGVLPFNALVDPSRDAVGDVALMPVGQFAPDLATVAETLIGLPHALGGRTETGMDCAAMVQACLMACGRPAPRYADGQAELGQAVAAEDLQRGDLVLWPHPAGGPGWTGHSAIAMDADMVIHASGRAGEVCRQPLAEADANQRAEGFGAPIFRRL
ncbi:MAG: NlpC/P60 family protein [Brevundimonas sp.]|uniref:C40 family peptidase n=1 Tax=Brevundimonas sp. TaxID=1871086 RepID=UPI00300211B6